MQTAVTQDVPVELWIDITGTSTSADVYGTMQRTGRETPWLAVSEAVPTVAGTVVNVSIASGEDEYGGITRVNAFLSLGIELTPGSGSPTPTVAGDTIVLEAIKTPDSYSPTTFTATVPAEYVATPGLELRLGVWGNKSQGFSQPELTTQAPDTPPDPPAPTQDLGERVAKFLGKEGDTDVIARAEFHAEIVTDYVYGYTRGRGFTDDIPERPLRSVIVAATARLTGNPEQVSYYVTGDYSERPAVLSGWLLHELQTLNNYRRRWA